MKEERTSESLLKVILSLKEKKLLLTLYDLNVQERLLTWNNSMQLDTGWQNFLFSVSPELTKFHLNPIHDVANTPKNLKLYTITRLTTAH
jgi:hypothetical protein